MVGLAGKFVVQAKQLAFEIKQEAGNAGLEAFATGGGVGGSHEILERDHPDNPIYDAHNPIPISD
jgi:hypothetical protein